MKVSKLVDITKTGQSTILTIRPDVPFVVETIDRLANIFAALTGGRRADVIFTKDKLSLHFNNSDIPPGLSIARYLAGFTVKQGEPEKAAPEVLYILEDSGGIGRLVLEPRQYLTFRELQTYANALMYCVVPAPLNGSYGYVTHDNGYLGFSVYSRAFPGNYASAAVLEQKCQDWIFKPRLKAMASLSLSAGKLGVLALIRVDRADAEPLIRQAMQPCMRDLTRPISDAGALRIQLAGEVRSFDDVRTTYEEVARRLVAAGIFPYGPVDFRVTESPEATWVLSGRYDPAPLTAR